MQLRAAGLRTDKDYLGRSLKAQLKFAGKKGVKYVVILGDEELKNGQATVRDMQAGSQEVVLLTELAAHLAGLIREAE